MAEKKGWIHLHRKIQDCILWESPEPFDCRSAWIDLILLANHEDKRMIFDGQPITVKKGQRITSVRVLAQRWHWGNNKTLKYLRMLEEENMIVRDSDKRRTLLTIVNYDVYNDTINTDEYTDGTETEQQRNTDGTLTEHWRNTDESQTRIIKNDKNEKNDKEHDNPPTPLKGGKVRKKDEKKICNRDLMDAFFQANQNAVFDKSIMDALYDWCDYKEQKKQRYAKVGMKNLLDDVLDATKQYDTYSVAKSIRKCMASNYDGIYYKSYTQDKRGGMLQEANDLIARLQKQEAENEEE